MLWKLLIQLKRIIQLNIHFQMRQKNIMNILVEFKQGTLKTRDYTTNTESLVFGKWTYCAPFSASLQTTNVTWSTIRHLWMYFKKRIVVSRLLSVNILPISYSGIDVFQECIIQHPITFKWQMYHTCHRVCMISLDDEHYIWLYHRRWYF